MASAASGASPAGAVQVLMKQTASVAANAMMLATIALLRTAASTEYGRYSRNRIAGPAIGPRVRKLLQAKAIVPRPQRETRGTGDPSSVIRS